MNVSVPAILRKLILITVPFFFAYSVQAQILPSSTPEVDSIAFAKVRARMDSIRQYRPTVGLVLSGGGALGLAHLGVIRCIEELGIPVDVVTGTSMGGLVAGIYALGYKHDQLDSLVRAVNWPVMMSDDIPNKYLGYQLKKYRERFLIRVPWKYDAEDLLARYKRERLADKLAQEAGHGTTDVLKDAVSRMGIGMPDGILFGLNVRNLLSSISVGYQDSLSFSELPIPYASVATDMYAMKPKYWTKGNITSALRSTMAIPFYFRAVREGGEVLVDGGMRDNYPADLAQAMGADIIIGSEIFSKRTIDQLSSPVDLLMRTITLMSSYTMESAKQLITLDIHHNLTGYNMMSFDDKSVDKVINKGYENALEYKESLQVIAAAVSGKEEPKVVHHAPAINLAQAKVRVQDVRFTGIAEGERNKILQKIDFPKDGLYDRRVIERMLNRIYGTNAFEAITYRLEGSGEPYTLVFDCQKGQVNDAAVGIRADSDEFVAAILHLGLGTRRLGGPRLAVDMKLGTNPSLYVDGSYKFKSGIPTFGLTFRNRLINMMTQDGVSGVSDKLFTMAGDLYIADSRMTFGSMKAGLTAEMDPYEHYLSRAEEWKGYDMQSYWLSAFANLKLDTFDDSYFPTKGFSFSLDGRYVFKGYSIDLDPSYEHPVEDLVTPGGQVPGYFSGMASLEGACTFGQWFTIHPKVYLGWYSAKTDYLNPKHVVSVGGFMPNRYSEHQMPFFGLPSANRQCLPVSGMAQLDLRFRLSPKNFFTVRSGAFRNCNAFNEFFSGAPIYAFGAEYARQAIVGPLKISVQWCNVLGVSAYASVGFDF